MAEGDNGKMVRNNLVEAMWNDVDNRLNKLGVRNQQIFY